MNAKIKRIYLSIEFTLFFFGVPLLLYFNSLIIHPTVVLLPVLVIILLILRYSPDFTFRDLIAFNIPKRILIKNGLIVLFSGLIMLLGVIVFERDNLFNLPAGNIWLWLMLCIFYPVFSAYGQEVVYRTFLFNRYRKLFKNERLLIIASGVTFSYVHIVYYSHISILLTLFAGLYLARVYSKTRSVLFTAILHGLLGIIVFTIGLGQYFWLDMFEWIH